MERDDRQRNERRPSEEDREHRSQGRDESHRGKDRGSVRRHDDRHYDDRRSDRRRSRSRSPRYRRSRSPRQWRSRSRSRDRDRRDYGGGRRNRRPDRPRFDDKRDDPNREPVLTGLPSTVAPQAVARIQAQLAKRRALWQNKDKPAESVPVEVEQPSSSGAGTATVWKAAAFREDQDGKMTAKFKRLMGMKEDELAASGAVPESEEVLKKQADLFTNLDMQYERARAATHTAKGMGLGFGSLGSGVPR